MIDSQVHQDQSFYSASRSWISPLVKILTCFSLQRSVFAYQFAFSLTDQSSYDFHQNRVSFLDCLPILRKNLGPIFQSNSVGRLSQEWHQFSFFPLKFQNLSCLPPTDDLESNFESWTLEFYPGFMNHSENCLDIGSFPYPGPCLLTCWFLAQWFGQTTWTSEKVLSQCAICRAWSWGCLIPWFFLCLASYQS